MNTPHKGFVVPLLLILATIFFIGGGSYAYLQTKPNAQLATENSDVQATSTAQIPSSQNADWHVYHNVKYGFTLVFPESWKGYRVQEQESTGNTGGGVLFGIKDQDMVFGVAAYTNQGWEVTQKEAAEFGGPFPGPEDIIARNSNYIFTRISPQDLSENVFDLAQMRHSILSTISTEM